MQFSGRPRSSADWHYRPTRAQPVDTLTSEALGPLMRLIRHPQVARDVSARSHPRQ